MLLGGAVITTSASRDVSVSKATGYWLDAQISRVPLKVFHFLHDVASIASVRCLFERHFVFLCI